ncbi:helix-turn-helix domain-containing protein [Sulfoacidibacillus thermotolerans]|uniref:HTH cro/C1-type domain-containing protein n=1 Tax=Sulfoacidibacillus thermotolerans TaxID=1765684 RepID=A0A2U3DBT2_SULT2|nr:helix-turn-helix domain-containing protein [Sulfoacidibacillus thermotolerans]PWI58741.1 hypothetical protein BM613_01195 [Sulfoacidibacillus thermotolerans]
MSQKDNAFGLFLRSELAKRGLSMRRLADLCGVDPATVSRLASGKQRPRPEHLLMLARALKISLRELWAVSGYTFNDEQNEQEQTLDRCEASSAPHYQLPELESLDVDRIISELRKCKEYAGTQEGRELILRDFHQKVNQIQGIGPVLEELKTMYMLFQNEELAEEQRRTVGSALLYFILATDIIPDYSFPLGYLDDAVAIDLVWREMKTWEGPWRQ